ncbi:MAG: cob(I)yrinic acid a,c-diamide adenosyltransferase [Candidatus Nomurabacteria bacterium]|nr:cob(I)yrinic acid a,c-diamide adenosyltransferase [Candidatus Nomurabacteria bacterium]
MKKAINNTKKVKNILYTGLGDKGTTTLFGCNQERISKSAAIVEALGSVDELNAYLGIMKVYLDVDKIFLKTGTKKVFLSSIVEDIQQNLFIIQAELAGVDMFIKKNELTKIENTINKIGEVLPPITSFTISGGSVASSGLDFARTLARKSERRVVSVSEEGSRKINSNTISYMNRLSSILFALSRYSNYILSIPENHPDYNK